VPKRTVVALTAIPLVVVLLFLFVPGLSRRPWTPLRIGGAILAAVGYGFLATARVQLGKSFSVMPRATALVTHGLYSRIRNPMYVFLDVTLLGLIFALQLPWLLLLLAVLITGQVLQSRREARLLEQRFGPAFLAYRKQTWF
jgi:protein-S-isoprenylcysteine O-methyltransferase Ste14